MPKIVAQKEDWIRLGYQLFSNQGISGIVIEKMGRSRPAPHLGERVPG